LATDRAASVSSAVWAAARAPGVSRADWRSDSISERSPVPVVGSGRIACREATAVMLRWTWVWVRSVQPEPRQYRWPSNTAQRTRSPTSARAGVRAETGLEAPDATTREMVRWNAGVTRP
jgi:hypothetical protein